jgi:cytochrome c oxidase subunit II
MAIANTQVQFDNLFWLFTYLAIAVAIVVYGMLAYYVWKYRAKPGSPDPDDAPVLGRLPIPRGHKRSAIITLSLSTIILSVLIIGSFGSIDIILSSPAPCTDISIAQGTGPPVTYNCSVLVTGHQFYWDFNYPGYTNRTINSNEIAPFEITPQNCPHLSCVLAVPVDHDIRINVTSADVFHNFGVIAFSIKADAYPGHVNDIWFNADQTGNYTIQCYELCGSGHAFMMATLDVMPVPQFVSWYNNTIVH